MQDVKSASSPGNSDSNTQSHGLLYSLADYHWHLANWDREELEQVREFFARATGAHPQLEKTLIDELRESASFSSISGGSDLIAHYLIASGKSLLNARKLGDEFLVSCKSTLPQAPTSSIIECVNAALSQTTALAFELYADDIKQCAATIAVLQKLFFFQSALLRDLFSNTESFNAGTFDETTGLPDHRTSLATLVELLGQRRDDPKPLAVVVIHIAFSHLASDASAYALNELLFAQAAERVQQSLRETDIVGRLNRDEFMAVLPHASGAGVAILAASKIIRTLSTPFEVEAGMAYPTPIVGISLFPEHASEGETLLHYAEIARERARTNRERYAVYDPEFHRRDRLKRSMEALLRTAIQENELAMHFQPKADLISGAIIGAEALLRWNPPGTGPVPPTQIIALAEECDLISSLTMWVMNASLRHWSDLAKGGIDIKVSVNVTPTNLSDPELPDFIAQALSTWGVPADRLIIELTETAMIGDHERTIDTLHHLKNMGLLLSVDDFGTGYSSMAYLKRMPLDELKVDQVFVRSMLFSREDERIVRSIIDLAHHFDLKVVAEGVENPSVLQFLRTLGCDIAQGYLISKPLPIDEFIAWWRQCQGRLVRPVS